jgi:serine/threonine protein kinase/tetratricopeptide (TPR) repeat protein
MSETLPTFPPGTPDQAAPTLAPGAHEPVMRGSSADRYFGDDGRPEHPERIGPYRIEGEIGGGGMGNVYAGLRDDGQVAQRVAIKVIRRGMDSDEIVRRFRREQRVQGLMKHPNIAQMLDAGTMPDGRPYIVMEHVEGQPIDVYCDKNELTIRQRLELFRRVCDAVAHAHGRLVVHRDLKPSNILVTPTGVPKLLDFGIAKLMDANEDQALITRPESRVMTPEYASPEQLFGDPITVSSDVYSLGVLLYELMTGVRPYAFEKYSHDEYERKLKTEPERPSTRVAQTGTVGTAGATRDPATIARARDTEPRSLRRQLDGDIDNIVVKAMEKVAGRRYRSVEALSEDIRRHLNNEPVEARPKTFVYVATRFMLRNRGGVAAAGLVVALLVGWGITTTVLWNRTIAERNRAVAAELTLAEVEEAAETAFNDFFAGVLVTMSKQAGAEVVQKAAGESVQQYVEKLKLTSLRDKPGTRRISAAATAAIALSLAGIRGSSLGFVNEGAKVIEEAVTQRRRLADDAPNDPSALHDLAVTLIFAGDIIDRVEGRGRPEALKFYDEAMTVAQRAVTERPQESRFNRTLATALQNSADRLDAAQGPERLRRYQRSYEIRAGQLARIPDDSTLVRDMAIGAGRIGDMQLQAGDTARALASWDDSIRLRESILAQEATLRARRDVLVAREARGRVLLAMKRATDAATTFEQAAQEFLSIRDENPNDVRNAWDILRASAAHANALLESGNNALALTAAAKAYERSTQLSTIFKARLAPNTKLDGRLRSGMGDCALVFAGALLATGDKARAGDRAAEARDLFAELAADTRDESFAAQAKQAEDLLTKARTP